MNRSVGFLIVLLSTMLFLTACTQNIAGDAKGGIPGKPGDGGGANDGPPAKWESCSASDTGIAPDIAGTVTAENRHGNRYTTVTHVDSCENTGLLTEWACDGARPVQISVNCPNGCEDGACQPRSLTPNCFNGIQDGDETGIDCGGSCSIVCEEQYAEIALTAPGGSSARTALAEEATTEFNLEGTSYEVTNLIIGVGNDGRSAAKFLVNGEVTDSLQMGDSDTVSSGASIELIRFLTLAEMPIEG